MTDLYEAGDINQTGGGGAAPADDEYDDNDVEEVGEGNESDEFDDDDGDGVDEVGDGDVGDGNEGNQVTAVDGGTSLSVLTYLAKSLSNEPESVVIETEERRNGLRLNLHVAPEDMGRVIGRRGRTAQAIRTLVNVAGVKDGVQASVDIVDD